MAAKKKRSRTGAAGPVAPPSTLPAATLHRLALLLLFLLPFVFYFRHAFGSGMLYGTDWLGAGSYGWRHFMAEYVRSHGRIALWWPAILAGQPTVAGFFADLFYPTLIPRLFLPVHVVWTWTFILHIFIAGLGTYLFLKQLRLGVMPSFLGGVAYMFAGSLMTLVYAGHDGRLMGTALMPLALFFLARGMDRRRLVWFVLSGLVVALQLFSGHLQKVLYTGLMLLAYFLFEWVRLLRRERSGRTAVRLAVYFAVGMGFAVALSAIQYLPVFGNMPYAARGQERGYAYATSWSLPIVETFDLFTPRFSGGLGSYWGKNAFKLHSEYLGILPLVLAAAAAFGRWKDRRVRFFSLAFVVTLLMAWGGETPFYYLPYYLIPGISRIRGPAMIFFLAAFSLAALAAFGARRLLDAAAERPARLPRTVLIAGIVPLGLLLLFAVGRGPLEPLLASLTIQAPQRAAALAANWSNMLGGFLIGAVVGLIGLALIWSLFRRRLRADILSGILVGVMTLDIGLSLNLWSESSGYIRSAPPPEQYFAPDEPTDYIRKDTSLFRVLPVYYERSDEGILAYNGIQSAGGQLPNPLQSYQDFIGAGSSVMFQPGNLLRHNYLNLMNIRYLIAPTLPDDISGFSQRDRVEIMRLKAAFSQPGIELAQRGARYSVYRNDKALPRAFLASSFLLASSSQELFANLDSPEFDPGPTVLLYDDPGIGPGPADSSTSPGTVRVVEYDANRIELEAQADRDCILVLSENYHPDWRATVDGSPASVLRAYHTLRAVTLSPGRHRVRFEYQSGYYRLGRILTLGSVLFLLLCLGQYLVWRRHRIGETEAQP